MKFHNQTAIVTGGGTGIGRAIAFALAREGASVCVCGRTESTIDETANLIQDSGGKALAIPADVSREENVSDLVERTRSKFGFIQILVNNAGIAHFKNLWELTPDEYDTMMDVNARGTYLTCRAVIPEMIEKRNGRILNIASVAGVRPYPAQGGYCASKHAQLALSKVLSLEVQEYGITVQAISPGGVDTPLARGIRDDVDFNEWMRPEEVAEAAVYLLSQEGVAVTDHLVLRREKAQPWSNASG